MVKHFWEPNAVNLVYFRRYTPLSEIYDFSIFEENHFFGKSKNAFKILSNKIKPGVFMVSGKVVVFDRIWSIFMFDRISEKIRWSEFA